jgi:hypothetical protein
LASTLHAGAPPQRVRVTPVHPTGSLQAHREGASGRRLTPRVCSPTCILHLVEAQHLGRHQLRYPHRGHPGPLGERLGFQGEPTPRIGRSRYSRCLGREGVHGTRAVSQPLKAHLAYAGLTCQWGSLTCQWTCQRDLRQSARLFHCDGSGHPAALARRVQRALRALQRTCHFEAGRPRHPHRGCGLARSNGGT